MCTSQMQDMHCDGHMFQLLTLHRVGGEQACRTCLQVLAEPMAPVAHLLPPRFGTSLESLPDPHHYKLLLAKLTTMHVQLIDPTAHYGPSPTKTIPHPHIITSF